MISALSFRTRSSSAASKRREFCGGDDGEALLLLVVDALNVEDIDDVFLDSGVFGEALSTTAQLRSSPMPSENRTVANCVPVRTQYNVSWAPSPIKHPVHPFQHTISPLRNLHLKRSGAVSKM